MPSLIQRLLLDLGGGLSAPGSAPSITSPADNATTSSQTPTITASAVTGATGYDFDVATDSAFVTIVQTVTNDADGSWAPGTLSNLVTHYVRVRARNAVGAGAWSDTITFLPLVLEWQDELTTDRAAGAINGTLTEPGGQTRAVTDGNSVITIGSAKLTVNGSLAQQNGYVTTSLTRTAGRIYLWKLPVQTTLGALRHGATVTGLSASTMTYGFDYATFIRVNDSGATLSVGDSANLKLYDAFAFIEFATGGVFYGHLNGSWYRLWLSKLGTSNLLWKLMGGAGSASTILTSLDALRIGKQTVITQASDLTLIKQTGVSGTDYTVTPDTIAEIVINSAGTLGGTAGIDIRKSATGAGTNFMRVWFDTSGNLLWQRFIAGVGQSTPTTLASTVLAINQSVRLTVIVSSQKLDVYTQTGTSAPVKRGNQIGDSATNLNNILSPFLDATAVSNGYTLGELQVLDVNTVSSVLDNLLYLGGGGLPAYKFFLFGDSRAYQPYESGGMLNIWNATNPAFYTEKPSRLGITGYTVRAWLQGTILADALALRPDVPDFGIIELGGNDCYLKLVDASSHSYAFWDGTGADWVINATALLSALHTKYPSTKWWWSQQWFVTVAIQTELGTMNSSLIPQAIANAVAFGMDITLGISEQSALSPNTAVYMQPSDEFHPSYAGGQQEGTAYLSLITPYFT